MIRSVRLTVFITILFFFDARAWDASGHKIIVQIAKSRLDKSVIDLVDHYLKGKTWEETACWMDEIKSTGGSNYMKPWHYVNIERDKTYIKTKEPNVINQLEYYIKILQDRSTYNTETINEALKIVFHLIGDITQPLHCGYPDDKGGNNTEVLYQGKKTNLHKLWDSQIVEETKMDIWSCSRVIIGLSQKQRNEIQKLDVQGWAHDSRLYLKDVYDYKDGTIEKAYIDKNAAVIEKQFIKAGLRLAGLLQACFSG